MGGDQAIAILMIAAGAALAVPWLASTRLARLVIRAGRARRSAPDLSPFHGRVFVLDGDTVEVSGTRVRLFGMDAPELSQDGGLKAKSHLIRLAGGEDVRVEPHAVDCYDRIVARVWLGDTDLSEAMVRGGFAIANSRWHNDYDSAELDARRARRGLWADDPFDGIRDPAAHRRRMAAERTWTAPVVTFPGPRRR
jgi:endonuclease YncB( thermonuclease family)